MSARCAAAAPNWRQHLRFVIKRSALTHPQLVLIFAHFAAASAKVNEFHYLKNNNTAIHVQTNTLAGLVGV